MQPVCAFEHNLLSSTWWGWETGKERVPGACVSCACVCICLKEAQMGEGWSCSKSNDRKRVCIAMHDGGGSFVGQAPFGGFDFFGRNDVKAETPVLWPPHANSWLIGKDSDAGRDWGQEEKGTTEDEMAGWHHWLDGREWTPGVGDGQGGLACCDSWGRKESDTTERLIWSDRNFCLSGILKLVHGPKLRIPALLG